MSKALLREDCDLRAVGCDNHCVAVNQQTLTCIECQAGCAGFAHYLDCFHSDHGNIEAHVLLGLRDFDDRQFTVKFPHTFGGSDTEITHIITPLDGSHVPLKFGISAKASGPDSASRMQIYVDGIKQADYFNVSNLPGGTTAKLPGPGLHRVAVQTYDHTKGTWVKSVIYVSSP